MTAQSPSSSEDRLWSAAIRRAEGIGDRGFRKWIASGRFPPADSNLNGRLFWLRSTYEHWKAEVLAGRYAKQRRPGSAAQS
jgi:hypothetical protein